MMQGNDYCCKGLGRLSRQVAEIGFKERRDHDGLWWTRDGRDPIRLRYCPHCGRSLTAAPEAGEISQFHYC